MCCCCGRCPLLAHLDRASLGERVSVERWRRLGPCSQRGKVHRRPCPLAAPVLWPSFPGECSWRPKGGRQRAEVGGGEGAIVAALQQIYRTAHFGVDPDSDMSLFLKKI